MNQIILPNSICNDENKLLPTPGHLYETDFPNWPKTIAEKLRTKIRPDADLCVSEMSRAGIEIEPVGQSSFILYESFTRPIEVIFGDDFDLESLNESIEEFAERVSKRINSLSPNCEMIYFSPVNEEAILGHRYATINRTVGDICVSITIYPSRRFDVPTAMAIANIGYKWKCHNENEWWRSQAMGEYIKLSKAA